MKLKIEGEVTSSKRYQDITDESRRVHEFDVMEATWTMNDESNDHKFRRIRVTLLIEEEPLPEKVPGVW